MANAQFVFPTATTLESGGHLVPFITDGRAHTDASFFPIHMALGLEIGKSIQEQGKPGFYLLPKEAEHHDKTPDWVKGLRVDVDEVGKAIWSSLRTATGADDPGRKVQRDTYGFSVLLGVPQGFDASGNQLPPVAQYMRGYLRRVEDGWLLHVDLRMAVGGVQANSASWFSDDLTGVSWQLPAKPRGRHDTHIDKLLPKHVGYAVVPMAYCQMGSGQTPPSVHPAFVRYIGWQPKLGQTVPAHHVMDVTFLEHLFEDRTLVAQEVAGDKGATRRLNTITAKVDARLVDPNDASGPAFPEVHVQLERHSAGVNLVFSSVLQGCEPLTTIFCPPHEPGTRDYPGLRDCRFWMRPLGSWFCDARDQSGKVFIMTAAEVKETVSA